MAILNKCCGMNLRTGSFISGVLVMVVCLITIGTSIAMFVLHSHGVTLFDIAYVSFALDFLIVALCVTLFVGISRNYAGRVLLIPFIAVLPIHVLYEAVLMIWGYTHRYSGMDYQLSGLGIAWLTFEVFRLVLHVCGWFCVVSRYQEMTEASGDALPGSGERSAIINPAETKKPDYLKMQP